MGKSGDHFFRGRWANGGINFLGSKKGDQRKIKRGWGGSEILKRR